MVIPQCTTQQQPCLAHQALISPTNPRPSRRTTTIPAFLVVSFSSIHLPHRLLARADHSQMAIHVPGVAPSTTTIQCLARLPQQCQTHHHLNLLDRFLLNIVDLLLPVLPSRGQSRVVIQGHHHQAWRPRKPCPQARDRRPDLPVVQLKPTDHLSLLQSLLHRVNGQCKSFLSTPTQLAP